MGGMTASKSNIPRPHGVSIAEWMGSPNPALDLVGLVPSDTGGDGAPAGDLDGAPGDAPAAPIE